MLRTKRISRFSFLTAAIVFVSLFSFTYGRNAQAANPPPVQTFYVPFPEDQLLLGLRGIANTTTPTNPMTTYISIAAVADGTIVYYDQWENGYDADIANPGNLYSSVNPGGTQIWGDRDPSNGAPPGIPGDIINAGTVLVLNNQLNSGTLQSVIDFDGRDKFAVTKTVAVTRTGWASGSNTLLAGAVEVYDTSLWGTDYRAPVGENIPDATDFQMFEYTSLAIMAGPGGASVQIDANADGTYETTVTLAEGQSHFVNGGVNVGAKVVSNNPVQVDILTGDRGSNYESRDSALLPVASWSSGYYTPVSTPNIDGFGDERTTVWLYNPGTSAITITYERREGGTRTSSALTVPGGPAGGYLKQVLPADTGARFYTSSGAPFYAFSATDSASSTFSNNQAWDWGFTLVPQTTLSPQALVGLGIGRDPTSATSPTQNGNPVWVTPVGNGETPVTVYIDYDADPTTGALTDPYGNKYDTSVSLRELEQAKIYDTVDRNQTGMLVYVVAPGVTLAAAWGQDPLAASAGAPGLDVGTSVPPCPLFAAGKNGTLYADYDNDGFVTAGDELEYEIVINNIGRIPVPDILLKDSVPSNTTYVAGSTYLGATQIPDQIPGGGILTAFPLDEGGVILDFDPSTPAVDPLPVGESFIVTFRVKINNPLPVGTAQILNTASVSAIGSVLNFTATTFLGGVGDRVWNDLDNDGIQDPDEPGIAGVVVNLYASDGTTLKGTATTDSDGYYAFTGLAAGSYIIEFVKPAGSVSTLQNQGPDDALDSDADPTTGRTAVFTLTAGETNNTIDAGFYLPARIEIQKTPDTQTVPYGETATFTIKVTNTGDVPLSNVTVSDPAAPNCAATIGGLGVGQSTTYECSLENVSGPFTNVARASGTHPNSGAAVWDDDDADVLVGALPPSSISLTKTPDFTTYNALGQTITYTYTITNTGGVVLNGPFTVTDDMQGTFTCGSGPLSPGTSTFCTSIHTITPGDLDAGSITNTATVSGNGVTSNQSSVTVGQVVALKSVKDENGGNLEPGDTLLYTIVIQNRSGYDVSGMEFTDSIPANTTYVAGSVSAPAGSVVVTETPTLRITGITVPGNGQVIISFRVQVFSPLPSGVTEISNQGAISYNSTTNQQTDGDTTQPGNQPTIIPVTAGANFNESTKSVALQNDADNNTFVSPSDTLRYTVVIVNTGNQNGPAVFLLDPIPANTTYVTNSVTASSGTATYNSGQNRIEWNGGVNAGASVTITFDVTVNIGITTGTVISNQGTINNTVKTDGNPTEPGDQPTEVKVGGSPQGVAIKSAEDENGGNLEPGDTVLYNVVMHNQSGFNVSGIEFVDSIPANTTYVAGSVSAPAGSVVMTETPTLRITGITLPAYAQVLVSFRVMVSNLLPDGVSQIVNQGTVSYDSDGDGVNDSTQQTDGDTTQPGNQPTVTPVTAGANFDESTKSVALQLDANGDGLVSPGDTLRYTMVIVNTGNQDESAVILSDPIPANTTYVANSVTASSGIPIYYGPPDNRIEWNGGVNAGASVTITFDVTVNIGITTGTVISNQGIITYDSSAVLTDGNPTEPGDQPTEVKVGGSARSLVIKSAEDENFGNLEPGDTVRYTIAMLNQSGFNVTGIEFVDSIPANTTYVAGSVNAPDGSVVVTETPTLRITGITLPAYETVTVSFRVMVNNPLPEGVTQIANQGTVVYDSDGDGVDDSTQTDGNETLPGEQFTVIDVASADLSITKSDSVDPVVAGESLTYTITVTNKGPSDASDVVVTETLPAGVELPSTNGCLGDPSGVPICALGMIPAGGSKTYTVTVLVNTGTTGTLINKASVTSDTYDLFTYNNSASQATAVNTIADLGIAKTANPMTPGVNGQVVFTLTVKNDGPSDATGVEVTDILPSGLSYVSHTSGMAYDPGTGVWTIGTLMDQAQISIDITATVNEPGKTINIASITASNVPDPDFSNNSSSLMLNQGTPQADLAVQKTVNNAIPQPDDEVVFTITVTNNGPDSASGITLTDVLPGALIYKTYDSSVGSYNQVTGVWTVGALGPGAHATLRITAWVGGIGEIINTVVITASGEFDPDITNNQSSAVINQNTGLHPSLADLAVQKTVNESTVNLGEEVVFTIVVRNNGPDDAHNVAITDVLPAGLQYVSSDPSQGTYATNIWSIGTIPAGSYELMDVVAQVTGLTPQTNTATVTGTAQFDPNSDNDSDSATVTPLKDKERKQAVLTYLQTLAQQTQGNPAWKASLQSAITYLQNSLNPLYWRDGYRVKTGYVFDYECNAVAKLQEAVSKGLSQVLVINQIKELVAIDRELAVIQIADAVAVGGSPTRIAKANTYLAQGDSYAAQGQYTTAINRYKLAWQEAYAAWIAATMPR